MRIGWVDFSDEERQRANQVLEMAGSKGAIDELGLGILRDGFSYKFFPGTSTLHTHARYYFLTAYLMKDLARKFSGAGREAVNREFVRGEKATARALARWCAAHDRKDDGIVGKSFLNGPGWAKQTPAAMNWAAMSEYGILKDNGVSPSSYLNMVAASSATKNGPDSDGDDELAFLSPAEAIWNVPIEGYVNWSDEEISVDLLPCEAQTLFDAICKRFPNSLYASLLQNPECLQKVEGDFGFISLVDSASAIVPDFQDRETLELGADFSSLAALLHIRFNYLIRHLDADQADKDSEQKWEEHFADGSAYKSRALRCNLDAAFAAVGVKLTNERDKLTRQFLLIAQGALARNDLPTLDKEITNRELQLKGRSRSKILNGDAYRNEWYGGTEFTYRLSTVRTLVEEIVEPLKGGTPC